MERSTWSQISHLEVHFGGSESFYPNEGTLVGILPASASHITGQIPVVGTFQIDQTQPGFVRVVAVDRSGNRSGPSEATPCTPRRIKDEYIDSLTVSKLTAGTLTADTLLAAELEVGAGGNVKLTDGSLDVYEGRTGLKKVEVGNLADGDYGLALVNGSGQLTKLHDFVFGPRTASVEAQITANATAFTGGGPDVQVMVGETGRLLITLSCQMEYSSVNIPAGSNSLGGGRMSFGLSGANSLQPHAFRSLVFMDSLSLGGSAAHTTSATRRGSYTHFLEGLNPGLTTVFTSYSATYTGTTTSFRDRTLIVQPF